MSPLSILIGACKDQTTTCEGLTNIERSMRTSLKIQDRREYKKLLHIQGHQVSLKRSFFQFVELTELRNTNGNILSTGTYT